MEALYSILRDKNLEGRCLTSKACSWKTKQGFSVSSGYWKGRIDMSQKKERGVQGLILCFWLVALGTV